MKHVKHSAVNVAMWAAWMLCAGIGTKAQAAPTAYNQSGSVATEGVRTSLGILSVNTSGSDSKYTIMSLPAHGTLEYKDSAGVWRAYAAGVAVTGADNGSRPYFTATAGYLGSDSFTWKITDAQGGDSNIATFSLSIVANTAPTAKNSSATTVEGSRVRTGLSYTDPDAGQPLTFTLVSAPANGSMQWYDTTTSTYKSLVVGTPVTTDYYIYYTPNAGFSGTDSFRWKMSDGVVESNVATVTVTVTPNTVPVAYDQKKALLKNQSKWLSLYHHDPDNGQTKTWTIVKPPAHGTLSGTTSPTYTPASNYVGTDSFQWKVSDGLAESNVATYHLLMRNVTSRAGMLVLLVVRDTLLPEINAEVNRLKTDLQNEGYTAKIVPFAGTSSTDVVNLLKTEYRAPEQFVAGAILIGNVPKHAEGADSHYWEMDDITDYLDEPSLWVSRMWATGMSGGEVTRIKWALDANHAYRTGASRLPWTTYGYDAAGDNQRIPSTAADIYGVAAEVVHPDTALTQGGEIMDEEMHSDGWVGSNASSGHPSQVRYGLFSSCSSGRLGGPVNQNQMRYGGGNIFSVGAYKSTYETAYMLFGNKIVYFRGDTASFRARLAAGDTWGNISADMFIWEAMVTAGMWYGDLSLPVKLYPANAVPVIASFTSDKTAGTAPLTVNFSISASDPDGSIASYEWFMNGFNQGIDGPTHTTASGTLSHTYTLAHRYQAEVQAVDNWKARAWTSKDIVVGPEPGEPVRVNCGRNLAYYTPGADYTDRATNLWLHDQAFVSGTWGYSGGSEGIVAQAVSGTEDDTLYQAYRTGPAFTYKVPVSNGGYWLRLGLADMKSTAAGQRMADIDVEDVTQVSGLDVFAQAGSKNAMAVELYADVADGELCFTVRKNAMSEQDVFLNCFEVLPYSGGNRAPVAQCQSVATPRNTAVAVALTATDPDGDAMSYRIVSEPQHGTLSGAAPDIAYTPASGYVGPDEFAFTAADSVADGNTGVVSVTVMGLIAHWKLDETGGTTASDSSGNGNAGMLTNGPAWGSGRVGGALEFDGANDCVDMGDRLDPGEACWTVALWFRWDGKTGDNILYNKENLYGARVNGGYFRYTWQPHWSWDGGTTFPVTAGQWHHAAIVYDRTKQYLYRDGVLVYSRSQTGDIGSAATKLLLGARGDTKPSYFLDGALDDVRMYNRALSALEVAGLASGEESDFDQDGIPDATDPDDDNDGVSDADEAIAGTNPRDGADRFQVSGFGVQGGDIRLLFDSVSGRIYGVYYRDDLLNGQWLPLNTNISGTGNTIVYIDTSAGWRRFYRLRVRLP